MKINLKIIALSLGVLATLAIAAKIYKPFSFKGEQKNIALHSLLMQLNKNQLLGLTNAVVLGKVTNTKSFTVPSEVLEGEKEVRTEVTIAIDSFLYNPQNLSLKEMKILERGGETEEVKMIVEDLAPFQKDHTYIVFLYQPEKSNAYSSLGLQGVFEVEEDKSIGVGETQKQVLLDIFGRPLTLNQLQEEIAAAKPEPAPGLKEELK